MSVVGHGRIGGTAVGLQDAPIGQCCRAGVPAYLRTVATQFWQRFYRGPGSSSLRAGMATTGAVWRMNRLSWIGPGLGWRLRLGYGWAQKWQCARALSLALWHWLGGENAELSRHADRRWIAGMTKSISCNNSRTHTKRRWARR